MTTFDAADLMAALYQLPEDSAAAHLLAAYRELGQVAMRAVLSNGREVDVFSLEKVVVSLEMARPRLYTEMAARGVLGRQCGAVLRHASGLSSVCDRPYGHDGPAPTGHRSFVMWNAAEATTAPAPEAGDLLCQEPYVEAGYSLPCILSQLHEGPHMPNGVRLRRLREGEPQESAERFVGRSNGTVALDGRSDVLPLDGEDSP